MLKMKRAVSPFFLMLQIEEATHEGIVLRARLARSTHMARSSCLQYGILTVSSPRSDQNSSEVIHCLCAVWAWSNLRQAASAGPQLHSQLLVTASSTSETRRAWSTFVTGGRYLCALLGDL